LEGKKPPGVRCRAGVYWKFLQLLSSELTRRRFSVTLPNRFENPQRMRQFLQLRELFRITFLF